MKPIVSVVVRQHNEFTHLRKLFESIREQDYPKVEIVVVDSGSTDGSRELAAQYADKVVDIAPRDFTFGYSLNVGIRASAGEYIVIVSAHTYPTTRSWISGLIDPFLQNENICMTYGRQIGADVSNPAELSDFNRFYGSKPRRQVAPDYFCNNANSAIRKSLWAKHPFDEALSGLEDMEWAKHFLDQGKELYYEPKAEIVHIHTETKTQIKNRFFREALALKRMRLRSKRSLARDLSAEILIILSELTRFIFGKMDWKELRRRMSYRRQKILGHSSGIIKGIYGETHLRETLQKILDVTDNLSVVVKSPGNAELVELPIPELAPSDVLIQPAYVGICGTDREIMSGHMGYYREGRGHYPIVLGHEYSGVITRVGARAEGLQVGDKVVGECIVTCGTCSCCRTNHRLACDSRQEVGVLHLNGALTSCLKISAKHVHKIPDSISLKKAALAEPTAVVVRTLKQAGLWNKSSLDQNILVLGGGSLGNLAIKALSSLGYKNLSVIERSQYKLGLLKKYVKAGLTDVQPDLIRNADAIVDFTGSGDLAKKVTQLMRAQTAITFIGFPYEGFQISPEKLVENEIHIHTSLGSDSNDFKDALALLSILDVEEHLQTVSDIRQFKTAFDRSLEDNCLKSLIEVRPPHDSSTT